MKELSDVRSTFFFPTNEPAMLDLNNGNGFHTSGGNLFHVRAPFTFSATSVSQSACILPATSAMPSVKFFPAASDCGDFLTRHRNGICVGQPQLASNNDACPRGTCGERHLRTKHLFIIFSFIFSGLTIVKDTGSRRRPIAIFVLISKKSPEIP